MHLHVAVFAEGGHWIAQALEHDVRTIGANSADAVYLLRMQLNALHDSGKLYDLPPAPGEYWEQMAMILSL